VSNLFPDSREPARGVVNARLLHFLSAHCEIRVVSPRPTLPLAGGNELTSLPEYQRFGAVYPRTSYVPKVGSGINHRLMASGLRNEVRRLHQDFGFDVLLAAWIYPDGCAVVRLGEELGVPVVLVAQGSDVHEYLLMPLRRRIIVEHCKAAAAIITRSKELSRLLEVENVPNEKLTTIYNGVDADIFKPANKLEVRRELGMSPTEAVILYVGGFFPIKNPGLAVEAIRLLVKDLPDRHVKLVMIGEGTLWEEIRSNVAAAGLADRVSLIRQKTLPEVARYMQAADVLCVPSENEGVPNVMYEAFSCGLRVVATAVGGIPEVLCHDFLGRTVPKGDAPAMAAVLRKVLEEKSQSEQIAEYAQQFRWEKTAEAYFNVLKKVVG
jgi:teichuronic acid biosynthesis glycosyltransferase TuaC